MERKVDLRKPGRVGSYPSVEEKATLALACAIHRSESDDDTISASWSAQERAQAFANVGRHSGRASSARAVQR